MIMSELHTSVLNVNFFCMVHTSVHVTAGTAGLAGHMYQYILRAITASMCAYCPAPFCKQCSHGHQYAYELLQRMEHVLRMLATLPSRGTIQTISPGIWHKFWLCSDRTQLHINMAPAPRRLDSELT